jgi:hypothetical protein
MLARMQGEGAPSRLRRMRSVLAPWVRRRWLFRWGQGLSWQIPMRRNGGICSIEINYVNGFFAQLTWLLLILKYCEDHQLIPNVCLSGQYRDPKRGSNWLDYYFDLITPLTSEEVAERVRYTKKVGEFGELGLPMPHRMSLEESTRIFCKYLKPKPHIIALADDFWKHIEADGHVVGIHFRGSDKTTEAPRVSWEHCRTTLQTRLRLDQNIKAVLVASDEQQFHEYVAQSVKDVPVFAYNDHFRYQPGDKLPPHRVGGGEYEKGEDALINALLLSRCSTLIRTTSFLSAFATIFNPEIKVILLNKPYDHYLWYPEIEILRSPNTTYLPENPA